MCVCFKKSNDEPIGGLLEATHTLIVTLLRDLCEVEFLGGVVLFFARCTRLINVFLESTPHYQIVDLESVSRFKLLKNRHLRNIALRFGNAQPPV